MFHIVIMNFVYQKVINFEQELANIWKRNIERVKINKYVM